MHHPDDQENTAASDNGNFSGAGAVNSAWAESHPANEETLEAYEHGVAKYNEAAVPSVEGSVKEWVDKSLALLRPGAHILEIGSAHGRDADYIESQGFVIDRTDAANSFVEYMQQQGHRARALNVLTEEDYGGPYDMIYANAVLLHFTPQEAEEVLNRAHASLTDDGLLSFSVKIGEGAGWSDRKLDGRRFFTYWEEEPLRELVSSSGYEVIDWAGGQTGHDNGDWFHVIARKRKPEEASVPEK